MEAESSSKGFKKFITSQIKEGKARVMFHE